MIGDGAIVARGKSVKQKGQQAPGDQSRSIGWGQSLRTNFCENFRRVYIVGWA